MLRLYQIENNEALNVSVFAVGEKPGGVFPGSKTPFLDIYGEIGVDFDFGHPEISEKTLIYDSEYNNGAVFTKFDSGIEEKKSLITIQTQTPEKIVPRNPTAKTREQNKKKWSDLTWPVYILRGDSRVYSINIDLNKRSKAVLKGPLPMTSFDAGDGEACSIICLNSSPQVACIAMSNGTLYHSYLLDIEEETYDKMRDCSNTPSEVPTKEIVGFETVELELGLATTEDDFEAKYKCPIRLHVDESRTGRYFATHSAGVHSVTITSLDDLQSFVNGPEDVDPAPDLFQSSSTAEYLLCTKTSVSERANPVLGFSLYYEPTSVITLLNDGSLVTLAILYASLPPKIEDLRIKDDEEFNSPLKKMLKEPFDQYIQKILMKASSQPLLKLSSSTTQSQEQYYELLQRVAQAFREDYFKHHTKAREEIDKRIQTLNMLKKNQQREIEMMNNEREVLQEKASNVAEKYEDIKDKQDELLKRCENLLLMVSRKKYEPSDAEKAFMDELTVGSEKTAGYGLVIDKIKNKMKYQQIQMENWKAQEVKKVAAINETHANTIRNNLQETNFCRPLISYLILDLQNYTPIIPYGPPPRAADFVFDIRFTKLHPIIPYGPPPRVAYLIFDIKFTRFHPHHPLTFPTVHPRGSPDYFFFEPHKLMIEKNENKETCLKAVKRRSSEPIFNFTGDCLYCGKSAKTDDDRKTRLCHRTVIRLVKGKETAKTILKRADERKDERAIAVKARINSVHCIVTEKARYHDEY
ncbi:hypothetical protein NQ318_021564 [Aromia moschata]|uniref:Nuclear pore complex protein Nup88 n=1 Tax=Aromia moschata TaxID=1265417 RepID=A0AAV8YJG9_9CUCU|nr:hypothetical protein NQ318_021564 [Aromia moschata]